MDRQAPSASGTRETRLLLATIGLSVVMLVVLARFRFPDQGPVETAEPAPAPLERLAAQASYDELASSMADLDRRVRPGLLVVRLEPSGAFVSAARVTGDRAVLRLGDGEVPMSTPERTAMPVLGREPVTGIAVIAVSAQPERVVTPRSGTPRAGPRFVAVADATSRGLAFRPAYVGATTLVDDIATGRPLLAMATTPHAVAAGAALFTFAGTFLGIATAGDSVVTIVPGDALKALAENPPQAAGIDLGVDVQRLTEPLARVSGASRGVMVAAVVDGGPAAGVLAPGDVVQSLDGRPVNAPEEFAAIEETREPGRSIPVTFIRRGVSTVAQLSVSSRPNAARPAANGNEPGLTVRQVGGRSVVTAAAPGSAADAAGIQAGDVIAPVDTSNGTDIVRVFKALPPGGGTLVSVERGGRRRIVALEKK